jgi:hypothetical protein
MFYFFRWYTKARKAMAKTNKNEEFMAVEFDTNLVPTLLRLYFVILVTT